MAPHRAAALATCLLALAAAASAACLVDTRASFALISASVASHPLARCLTAFTAHLDASCNVIIEPNGGDSRNYVRGMWTDLGAPTTYAHYTPCPVSGTGTGATGRASVVAALTNFVYGTARPFNLITTDWGTDGKVALTAQISTGEVVLASILVYAVTFTNATQDFKYATSCTPFTGGDGTTDDTAQCLDADDSSGLATRCGPGTTTGKHGIVLPSNLIKICALCPAGTAGDGYTCTPCAGGKSNGLVGSTTCSSVAIGTYAPLGTSVGSTASPPLGLPCQAGSYIDAVGKETCLACPVGSYSWIPGARACLRCVQGVPETCTATTCGTTPTSPGGTYASMADMTCSLSGDYQVDAVSNCGATFNAALRLAFEVDGDCSIDIFPSATPISACTDPTDPKFGENVMRAYYHYDGFGIVIRSLHDHSTGTAGSSGYMVGTELAGPASTLKFWAVTTKASEVSTLDSVICPTALTISGGQLSAVGVAVTACPAGTYPVYSDGLPTGCYACPPGYKCPLAPEGTKEPCVAGTANPYYGQTTCAACPIPTTFTPYDGATSCTAPPPCNTVAGKHYDPVTQACIDCPAGTARAIGAATCQDCPAGQYSGEGAGACINCAAGSYNPLDGQVVCQTCPTTGTPRLTSYEGAASCTVLYVDTTCNTAAGTYKLDLTGTSAGAGGDPIAKCLSSFAVEINSVGSVCQAGGGVTVTPLAADGSYVKGMWGYAAIEERVECPAGVRAPTVVATTVEVAIAAALSAHIYGVPVDGAEVSTYALTAGVATLTRLLATNVVLAYAVTETSNTLLATVLPCAGNTNLCKVDPALKCALGAYGILVGANKICALCPAGTFSDDGVGCTPCPAGMAVGSVGTAPAGSCSPCQEGTYAQGGNSDCLLCPAGTYQYAPQQGSCNVCEDDSWSLYPGMTACLRCVAGVPRVYLSSDADLPSAGYHVLGIASAATATLKTDCDSPQKPFLTERCAMTPTATKLSVFVDFDCSVTIQPIMDPACAEPGATVVDDGYIYADTLIHGYYANVNTIKTLLPTTGSTESSTSYLLTLGTASGADLTLSFSSATSSPSQAGIATDECKGTVTVTGGEVAGTTPATDCPAGSYTDADVGSHCPPCPTGMYCTGGASATNTNCGTGTYQPLLGAAAPADCTTCTSPLAYTSYPGAAYCTVPFIDTTCGNGHEYDDSEGACMDCAAGYKRDKTGNSDATCLPCASGTSTVGLTGQTTCTACTIVNTVTPVEGMSKCAACPVGSVANGGRTECDICQPGFIQTGADCVACAANTFRSGDATPDNNVCKNIPAGYKEKSGVDARSEIALCDKGEFSAWETGSRVPSVPTTCQACAGNTYAPRMGMQKCLACKAGFTPTANRISCAACNTGDYRPAFDTLGDCFVCPVGSEVGPSNHAACTPCRPGHVMATTGVDECSACDGHTYQPKSGQTECVDCPVGHEGTAADIANTACTPCAKGYYNNVAGTGCKSAPVGTFINTTAATFFTPCQVGTFSAEAGSDTCDSCPPGQYSNTRGAKTCKTCPAGTFSAGRASSCVSCKPGYYAASGSGACSPCKPGSYSASLRSTTCSLCPAGKQCPLIATAVPRICGKGYFSNKDGARLCTPCPINTYQPATTSKQCIACGTGTNTRGLTGQSACQVVRTRTPLRLSMF